jgi:helix-turn-helix protein
VTVQALAWAIEQGLPGPSKLVLIALSNHADHTNGYCHFDATTISCEASIEVRSLWRYLGALERNGYLAKDERKPGDTSKREYWLVLDRDPALGWSWSATDQSADDDAPALSTESSGSATSQAPKSFRRAEQDKAREVPAAATSPGIPIIEGSKAYVAWCAHLRDRKLVAPFVQAIQVDGKWLRGFYMPTLFPPRGDQIENLEGAA